MPISRKLALDDAQIEEILTTSWNCRIATLGPKGRINLTPMWFGWVGGKIYIYGRGQKVENLRRDPTCTILVDRNEKFPELQAVVMQGSAQILEDAAAEGADADLALARAQIGRKYNGGHGQAPVADPPPMGATAQGRNARWMVFTPQGQVTWDNFKLAGLRR